MPASRPPRRTALPAGVQAGYPLARLSTVRTGGPAAYFVRADNTRRVCDLLGWAATAGEPVSVVGSGSNLLIADEGVRGLVIKLEGTLGAIERRGERMVCGGAARLPAVAARAAQIGLAGIEFGVNIPGTVGGAVRMNANAYGGQLARVLEWVEVATAQGLHRRVPDELDFAYRRSNLGPGEVVVGASFALDPRPSDEIKAVLADMRARRREAQPSGIKTFGSTFQNPEQAGGRTAGMLLEAVGARGLRVGGARFSPKHANFIENDGAASTADILALMDEGRRRVAERFEIELEPEVQLLGHVAFPWRTPSNPSAS